MELDDLQAKLKEAISTLSDDQLAEVADFIRFVKTAQSIPVANENSVKLRYPQIL